ncbi:MAG: endonuclease/exonuclease/phosphatase, partial [Bacteroidota bacterium]
MPWYNDLRPITDPKKEQYALIFPNFTDEEKMRTIEKLLDLRKSLKSVRLRKQNNKNLLLASWNIKEFGHLKARQPEAYFYIAEVISSFDLIAIQELKSGLKDLKILMRILGKHWKYIINDITEGRDGNSERSAYIYDTRRVEFSGLAGEIVIWKDLLEQDEAVAQLKRTPYITGFKTAWKDFALVNL